MPFKIATIIVIWSVFSSVGFAAEKSNISKRNYDLDDAGLQKILGWTNDCDQNDLCGGCYLEPSAISSVLIPKPMQDTPMKVSASEPAYLNKYAASVLQGDVKLLQPGREITADRVTFFRDDKTGKINRIILFGKVKFYEHGKLICAKQGNLDFANGVNSLNQVIYRFLSTNTPTGTSNVWGYADRAINDEPGVLKLKKATYTSCPPKDNPTWYLRGSELILNRNTGRGEVKHAAIFFKKIPVFYAPYFSFALERKRKSGFLMPTPFYYKDSGFGVDVPYYFNVAPNYDVTVTPKFFTKRGVLFDGLFRYLTPSSLGSVNLFYIPYDKAFINFRDAATVSQPADQKALQALKDSSSHRELISLQNESKFDQHWRGLVSINYATDDYFIQDFGNVPNIIDNDQLPSQADIEYSSDRWNFLGRLQLFQTLHPITNNRAQDQYRKLPQFNLSGDFPDSFGGLSYRLDSEIINFMHRDEFYASNATPIVAGARFYVMPSVSAPMDLLGGYITPKIQLHSLGYGVHDQETTSNSNTIVRMYPLLSLDSGIVLRRDLGLWGKKYTQELEPRLFYLFVPMRNQEDIPIFDTYLPPFDFNQLFRTNRFNGLDRVGDANQIAVAITTRLLDDSGQEKFNMSLGQIAVVHKHRVIIDSGNVDPLKKENLSPLVGQLQYFINPQIKATFDAAWDPNYHQFNTANISLQYVNGPQRVLNLWYYYALKGDQLTSDKPAIDLSRIGFSLGWKVFRQVNVISSLNYNTSYNLVQNYFCGLEYDGCCFAIRLVHGRDFMGIDLNNNKNYDFKVYIQFLLKGVYNLDGGGLGSLVADKISGYQDKFTNRI